MINFERLLDLNFWFSLRSAALSKKTTIILAVCFAIFLAAGIVCGFLIKSKKQNPPVAKLFRKLKKMFQTMAVVGFIVLFFSYEQIYFMSGRFWFAAWLIGLVVWAVFIALYALKKMPKEKDELDKKQKYLKYLA